MSSITTSTHFKNVLWRIAVKDFPPCLFSIPSFSNIFLKPKEKEELFPESKYARQSLPTKKRVMKPGA